MIHTYLGREDQGNGWRRRAATANGGRCHPITQNGYHSGMRPARILLALAIGVIAPAAFVDAQKPAYPPTQKGDVVDDYFGTKVPDPYRWMEDLDSKPVADWVAAQNAVTFRYLDQLSLRNELKKRITELWNYPKVALPFMEAGRVFYRKNSGLQKQSPLFVRPALDGSPTLVIDPNELWPDGNTSLSGTGVS